MVTCRECAYLRKCIDKATKEGYEHNVDFDPKDGCPGFGFKPNTATDTNADRIRSMTDEELANHLYLFHGLEERIKFCQNLPECEALLNTEDGLPEEKCVGCLLAWLKQPAEETNAPT